MGIFSCRLLKMCKSNACIEAAYLNVNWYSATKNWLFLRSSALGNERSEWDFPLTGLSTQSPTSVCSPHTWSHMRREIDMNRAHLRCCSLAAKDSLSLEVHLPQHLTWFHLAKAVSEVSQCEWQEECGRGGSTTDPRGRPLAAASEGAAALAAQRWRSRRSLKPETSAVAPPDGALYLSDSSYKLFTWEHLRTAQISNFQF